MKICASTPMLARKARYSLDTVSNIVSRVVDEVHLVHDDDDLADAEQAQEVAVPAGLFLHAFGRVDEDERGIGAGGAGHHVLEELLVAGRVDDDVLALLGAKPDLRGVDRDVLVALGLQRVHQIGPLERHAAALRDVRELLELAVGQRAGVVEQTADERGFAVVHVPDDDETELVPRVGHHMYPSRRSFSNASSLSWSCARPARSGTFVSFSSLDDLGHGLRRGLDRNGAGRASEDRYRCPVPSSK